MNLDSVLINHTRWELSGDVMADFSTPLLDAVHRKLNDPSLSCKETFGYDSPTFSGYGTGSSTVSIPGEPSQAPVTLSPTVPLTCPEGLTGSLPLNVCHEFYTCVYGAPILPVLRCPGK